MKNNNLLDKAFGFAVRSYHLSKYLQDEKREFIISNQIARSGMSIGANAEEANASQSKKEFLAKLQISYKESKETMYWLKLLVATKILTPNETESMLKDNDELCRIISSILFTTRNNLKNKS